MCQQGNHKGCPYNETVRFHGNDGSTSEKPPKPERYHARAASWASSMRRMRSMTKGMAGP